MDKDHRHCTPIRSLSQLQDKEYLPLKVIKKRIEGGNAFTAGDSAEDLSRVLYDPERQPLRTSGRYVPYPVTNPVHCLISIYVRTLTVPQTLTTHRSQKVRPRSRHNQGHLAAHNPPHRKHQQGLKRGAAAYHPTVLGAL